MADVLRTVVLSPIAEEVHGASGTDLSESDDSLRPCQRIRVLADHAFEGGNRGLRPQYSQCRCTAVSDLDVFVLESGSEWSQLGLTPSNEVADGEQPDSPIVVFEIRDAVLSERPIDCEARLVDRVEIV